MKKVKGLKSDYREHFEELRSIKAEVQYCQKLVDQCRQRLIQGNMSIRSSNHLYMVSKNCFYCIYTKCCPNCSPCKFVLQSVCMIFAGSLYFIFVFFSCRRDCILNSTLKHLCNIFCNIWRLQLCTRVDQ